MWDEKFYFFGKTSNAGLQLYLSYQRQIGWVMRQVDLWRGFVVKYQVSRHLILWIVKKNI